jgi:hypothetical protein
MSTNNEHNDINDPVVQDVLNEFRDELLISKNNKDMSLNTQPLIIQDMTNGNQSNSSHPSQPQHPSYPSHPSQSPHSSHPSQSPYPSHPSQPPYPSHPSHPSQQSPYSQPPYPPHSHQQTSYSPYTQMNKNDYMLYMDIELIKKNLIIVIIVFLIYFSGIINNIYDRIPEYLQENILSFDVYIKTLLLFIILYVISYAGYV